MPVASTKQRQQAKSVDAMPSNKGGWRKKLLFAGAGLVVVVAAAFFVIWGGVMADSANMKKYLEDKYAQKFEVTDIRTRDAGLGIPGLRVGIAHPLKDSDLTFEVGMSQSTGKYFDEYDSAIWEREEKPRVTAFLETIYGSSNIPKFDLIAHIPTSAEPDPIQGRVPSIDEAMSRYGTNFVYDISVKLSTNHDLSEEEIKNHENKIRQLVDFVLAKNISSPGIRYAINVENQNAGYLCNLYKEELSNQSKIEDCLIKKNGKVW